MSHLTFCQFFIVLYLLPLFIISGNHLFNSIIINKKNRVIWFLVVSLIFFVILIETSYKTLFTNIAITVFKTLLLILIINLIYRLKSDRFLLVPLLLTVVTLILSLKFRYLTYYIFGLIPLTLFFKTKKEDRSFYERNSKEILDNLREGVLITTPRKEILYSNRKMNELLNLEEESVKNFIEDDSLLESYYKIQESWYLFKINRGVKGYIVTASDVTERIEVKEQLIAGIKELNDINRKLQKQSEINLKISLEKERERVLISIEEIIKIGLRELKVILKKIEFTPPQEYSPILKKSRELLDRIREVVTRWRRGKI